MIGTIEVRPAENIHYDEMIRIYNEGFLPKYKFVSNDSDKASDFVDDFGVIDIKTPNREFVAVIDEKVVGILSIRFHGQTKKHPEINLSFIEILKKYGVLGIVKALRLDNVFSHHPPKGEIYIDSVSVSSDARGKGIGSALLNFAESFAKENQFEKLSLRVMFENERAKSLYEQLGYSVEFAEKIPPYIGKVIGYSGAYFMVKNIMK